LLSRRNWFERACYVLSLWTNPTQSGM